MPDARLVPGNRVRALARHVTAESEVKRRFGSAWKTQYVFGVVTSVLETRHPTTNRVSRKVVAEYDLGGGAHKTAAINMVSVKLPEPEPTATTQAIEATTHSEAAVADTTAGTTSDENEVPTSTTTTESAENGAGTAQSNNGVNTGVAVAAAVPTTNMATANPTTTTNMTTNTTVADGNLQGIMIATEGSSVSGSSSLSSSSTANDIPGATLATTMHNQPWYKHDVDPLQSLNGDNHPRDFQFTTSTGEIWHKGCNHQRLHTRLDVFLQLFPPQQLLHTVTMMNNQLGRHNHRLTTRGEILKFIGVLILMTWYEFTDCRTLWSSEKQEKYEPNPDFSQTGLSRHRFQTLKRFIRFSNQPEFRPEGMNSEKYRWLLVDDFIKNFNNHRAFFFKPTDLICVDESMVRWYGQGGDWINYGLPNYVAIDRKPENGCEIQNSCCGRTGIMLRLLLVKTSREMLTDFAYDEAEMNHGTRVVKELVEPWFYTNRVVCCDSYFSSVATAEMLFQYMTRMIGVVKTATKQYPMAYLSNIPLVDGRGDRHAVMAYDPISKRPKMLAFVWVDRERRYFISTASSVSPGTPIVRERMRQLVQDEYTLPERVELTIQQPKACEVYYSCCAKIDQHNRDRQDNLQIEKKIGVKDWSLRVNLALLGMCIVDSWKMWSQITLHPNGSPFELQSQFYSKLATELIDNTYDVPATRLAQMENERFVQSEPLLDPFTNTARSGISIHLTPTRVKKRKRDGTETNHSSQRRCFVCKMKTKFQCSLCKDRNNKQCKSWFCHSDTGRACFMVHVEQKHEDEY